MKKIVLVLIIGLLHITAVNLYAGHGVDGNFTNLTVEQLVAIGTLDGTVTPLHGQRMINAAYSWDAPWAVFSGLFRAKNYGTGSVYGFSTKGISAHSADDGTRAWAFGGYYMGLQKGTGTVTNLEGVHAMTGGNGTGAVTYNTPLDIMGRIGNAATQAATGIYIRDFELKANETGSSAVNYGIYMEEQTTGDQNYQIYSEGGQSYLGGSLGIGAQVAGSYKLVVAGAIYVAGGYYPSDARFKDNIATIESPLAKILNMRGVSYNWKKEEYKDRGFAEGRHYGVIGQEVEKVLPEVVKESPNGEKSVAYTELIPVLIEAVKEQQKMIEGLKAEVKQLRARGLVAGIQ